MEITFKQLAKNILVMLQHNLHLVLINFPVHFGVLMKFFGI